MRLFDLWDELTMWGKFGVAFVVAVAILVVIGFVRFEIF